MNVQKKKGKILREEAEYFLVLYNKFGTYQAVADFTGRSASSVSKWVKILQAEVPQTVVVLR